MGGNVIAIPLPNLLRQKPLTQSVEALRTKKIFHWPGGNIINIFNFDKDSNNEDINSQRKIVIKRTGEVLL